MTIVSQSVKSIAYTIGELIAKIRYPFIILTVVGFGVLIGVSIFDNTTTELTTSILVIILLLVIVVNNPLHGLLVWLFLHVFIDSWVELPMGAGIPDLSFGRLAVVFLGVFLLAQAAIGKFQFRRFSWSEFLIVATIVGIASAAPNSVSPGPIGVVQMSLTMFLIPMAGYFFAKNLVQDQTGLHKVFMAIALLGFVAGVYTIFEFTTGQIFFTHKDVIERRFFREGEQAHIRLIIGIMGSPGTMGRALAATIPVTFYLFLERKRSDIGKLGLFIMVIGQLCGIVLAMSRTPWYALLVALFVMQFFYPQFRRLFVVITLAALLVIWATWDQVSQSQAATRIGTHDESLDGREVRWQAGFNMLLEKPIRGWGFGQYHRHSGKFRTDGKKTNIKAVENDYLYIGVGSGLIGLAPYLLFIIVPLIYSWKLFLKTRTPEWSGFVKPETVAVFWAVILCLLITSYTAKQVQPVIRLMTFAVTGAIVGSHEHLLQKRSRHRNIKSEDINI